MTDVGEVATPAYTPDASLVPGAAARNCHACVTIPARNEESSLSDCLDAFARQVDLHGEPLAGNYFELILLLNNCTDRSASIARAWQAAHPKIALHSVELMLPPHQANAGTARKLLLDTAWQRLEGLPSTRTALLCTDADSTVAPDWIAQNLRALAQGADAVGGQIEISPGEVDRMPFSLRECYERDRCYGQLVAQLEDLLDPQPGDPWPRHQHHFGSSLSFTPQAYAAVGGMPETPVLEDAAFVHQLRRAGLCLRHEPAVRIFTSGRLDGRAKVGLAWQLKVWNELPDEKAHQVQSAAFLAHRFKSLRCLREAFHSRSVADIVFPTGAWSRWAGKAVQQERSVPDFLAAIDCDGLIDATFTGERRQPILNAIAALRALIGSYRAEGAGPAVCDRFSTERR